MLKKSLKAVAAFRTTHDAIAAESICLEAGVAGRLIPLPTEISAGCGLAFMMLPSDLGAFSDAVKGKVKPEGIYELMLRG